MAAQFRAGQLLGFPLESNSAATTTLSAAATWLAVSFVPDQARTLSAVRAFVSSVTGTLGATDITCSLYDSTGGAGAPGTAIETGKTPSATITASGWYDFTGFTTALTVGQTYWAVFKNGNATPASNNVTFRNTTGFIPRQLCGINNGRFGWARASSTNSGSTWSITDQSAGHRIAYADGSYDGMLVSLSSNGADLVYGTREAGMKFTSPANGVLQVAGIAFYLASPTGTPAGAMRFGLWTGASPSNVGYTNTIPATGRPSATSWLYSYFATTITIQPGTVVRVTLADGSGNADTSSNAYKLNESVWDSDSNSLALTPFEGTCVKTYFDGSSWTDTAGSMFGFALLLDTSGEFGASGGGPVGQIVGARSIGTY